MKSNYKVVIGLIVVITFFILLIKKIPTNNEIVKNTNSTFSEMSFYGYVINKYIDTNNHNYPILIIKSLNDSNFIKLDLLREVSGFYTDVNKKDTVFKELNSMDVYKIENKDTIHFKEVEFR